MTMTRGFLALCKTPGCHARMVITGADSRSARSAAAGAGWDFTTDGGTACPGCAHGNTPAVLPEFCIYCNGQVRAQRGADRCTSCDGVQPDLTPAGETW